MEYGFARRDQIVRNDAPVTTPPDRLGAHDSAPLLPTEGAQPREAGMKLFSQAVVGIIVKALILPERVYGFRNLVLPSAQPSQRDAMLIANLFLRERLRQDGVVELRI